MTAPTITFRIVVSADCNLRCTYCSTDCGRYGGDGGRMSDETLAGAVRLITESERFQGDVQLVPSGGEPLLHLGAIEALVAGVREGLAPDRRLTVGLTTNGVLLDEARAERLLQLGCVPEFSIDGPAAIHDRCRVFPDGRGSHALAVQGLQTWRRVCAASGKQPRIHVNAAVARDASLSAVMRFFDELAVDEVKAAPVQRSAWELEQHHGEASRFAREFVAEARRYIEANGPRALLETPPRLSTLGRMLTALVFGLAAEKHCGIGRTNLAIDRDGGVWPCDAFIGLDDAFRLGDVHRGIDDARLAALEARLEDYHAGCRGCAVETRCGELCLAQALLDAEGSSAAPTGWCGELRWIFGQLEALVENWSSP